MNERHSTTTAIAGGQAPGLTVLSCFWIGILLLMREAFARAPLFFPILFWLAGLMLVVAAVRQWRERLRAGGATLRLPDDPLPVGVPVQISVDFEREPAAGDWYAKVRVRRQLAGEEDPRVLWHTELDISPIGNRALFTFQLPADLPNTVGGSRKESIGCELDILGPHGGWSFQLATRPANERELASHGPSPASNAVAEDDPAAPTPQQRARAQLVLFAGYFLATLAIGIWLSGGLSGRNITLGPSYAVPAEMPAFALRISSWRNNRWGIQAQLEGTAHIDGRALELKDANLKLRGFLRCAEQSQCRIKSASLLLAQDRATHFVTLAESAPVPLDVRLRGYEVVEVPPVSFRLNLPATLARDDVYLKLELRTVDDGTMYIDSQKLMLQRMFAAQEGAADPCISVKRMDDAVRSGCPAEGAPSLDKGRSEWLVGINKAFTWAGRTLGIVRSPAPLSLNETLVLAVRHEANDWIPALINAGADPNARDPDNPQLTTLSLAAEFDDINLMDLLLEHGADPSIATTNDLGQTVTPLNRALRRDSAEAVVRLIAAGARPQPPDATGWSTMHVAAYEGAAMSLAELIHAGADVNQPSIARAQNQTPLMTAIQHADVVTVRKLIELGADPRRQDADGQDSCDWARRFKKTPDVMALVCADPNG